MPTDSHKPLHIDIRHGAEVRVLLDDDQLRELTNHVVAHTTEIHVRETRGLVQAILTPTANIFSHLPARLQNFFAANLAHLIAPLSTIRRDASREEIDYVKEFRDNERLSIAMVNGRAVGMLGYREAGHMPEGPNDPPGAMRTVYELCRASVLPEYERQGVYARLKEEVFGMLRKDCPQSPILAVTKNPTIKNRSLAMGYEEIPLELLLEIRGNPKDKIPELAAERRAMNPNNEWQTFLFDPLKQKPVT